MASRFLLSDSPQNVALDAAEKRPLLGHGGLLRAALCGLTLAFLGYSADMQPERVYTFKLPEHWRKAKSASLIIQDLEAPKNRAVILRVITADSSNTELGSFTLIGVSPEAKGNWEKPRVEINISSAFLKWAENKEATGKIRLRIRPYAGLREAPDYKWSAKEIRLEVR